MLRITSSEHPSVILSVGRQARRDTPGARAARQRLALCGRLAALLLLGAGAAHAADCLSGDTLADQRALASLRAVADANCPCAAYDGSPGHHRGDYRRCARSAVDAALGSGALRAECAVTALRAVKDATCGATNRIACARTAVGDGARSCRIKPPLSCGDRSAYTQRACAAQTHCAEVLEWTAGTCVDPRDDGPYGVGVRTIHYVKDSVVSPGTPRTLDTLVWYPTTPGAGPVDPALAGVVDAPLAGAGAPYPLLLFSHGSCGFPGQSTFLTARLASYGYVVAAPPHPGNTIYDGSACASLTALVQSVNERPADVTYVTDQLLAATASPASPLFGAIDAGRIGMSGHSFGGHTTFRIATTDVRFRVAIPMAAVVPLAGGVPSLPVPSLIMLGQIDSVLGGSAVTDLDDLRDAYAAAQPPKYLVEIAHAGHYAFSNNCFPSADCNPPTTLTQDEAHAIVQRWVLPFLERHLRGDASFAAFFTAPPPPGVLLVQQQP